MLVASRRTFLDRLAQTVGGTAAAFALLPSLENDYGQAPIVLADDKDLEIGRAGYDASGTKMSGYLVRQKGAPKRPAVIVVHENRGLNPHIEDVARRVAEAGSGQRITLGSRIDAQAAADTTIRGQLNRIPSSLREPLRARPGWHSDS